MLKIKDIFVDGGRLRNNYRYRLCENRNPSFRWSVYADKNDNRQKSYNIRVLYGKEILWDSGEVLSDKQEARYNGKPFPSGAELRIQLEIIDIYNNRSAVKEEHFYYGGIEWNADWIAPKEDIERRVVYFRKIVDVKKPVKSACIYVCGLGYHKISLNGRCIDDAVMDPAHSDYTKTCYYAVLPVDAASLNEGSNCLGVALAEGWRRNNGKLLDQVTASRGINFFGRPQLSLIFQVLYEDGTSMLVTTDENWKYTFGAVVESNIFDGEIYDANQTVAKWNEVDCTYDRFRDAVILPPPGGIMRPMVLEPIKFKEKYSPKTITNVKDNSVVVDFGQNIAGVVKLNIPSGLNKGQTIKMKHMEFLSEDGTLYLPNLRDAKACDTYITSADNNELEIWVPEFTYHGFRYAQIEGLGNYVQKNNLTALGLYTDLDNDSFFECGNPLVNKIHKNLVMTERANMHSILTDCPQRDERMGWMNDATVRFEETPYNFDIGRMFPKIVRDLLDVQSDDGAITCCAPFVFGNRPADPVCSSFLVAGMQSLLFTGNTDIIAEAYEGFCMWEDCLGAHSEGYIINYSYYGDWASPAYVCPPNDGAHSTVTSGIFMSTGYYYLNAKLLVEFAKTINKPQDAERYTALAENIKISMLAKWFDYDTCRICGGSQASQSFALWLGIIPEDKCQKAAEVIHTDLVLNEYKITTGNLCSRYLMDVLCDYGYIEDAWKIITRTEYPSFGYMIQNEATTIWERFELKKASGMNSHNHPMYGAVGYWFYAYLGGIKPLSPAFDKVKIQPYMPSDLLSCSVSLDSIKGDITVKWVKRYGKTYLYATIPFGVDADIHFNSEVHQVKSGYHVFEM